MAKKQDGPREPYSEEAERSVLGALLIDPDAILTIAEQLEPDDFYVAKNRKVYRAMRELGLDGEPLDFVTVSEALGGKESVYLSELVGYVPSAVSVKSYAETVREMAIRRRLLRLSSDVAKGAYDYDLEIDKVLGHLDSLTLQLHEATEVGQKRMKTAEEMMAETYEELEALASGDFVVVPTGFRDMDRILTGFRLGGLYVVAARTGIGKTSQLISHAIRLSKKEYKAALFSLEMSHQDVSHRLLTMAGAASHRSLVTGDITPEDWERIAIAVGKYGELPFIVDDTPGLTMAQLRSRALRLKLQGRLDILFVDYLQLLRVDAPRGTQRYREIGMITQGLKHLAKELRIPIVVAAQLGRSAENARPSLSDLRESGDIEQDSDGIIFLHRERDDNASVEQVEEWQSRAGTLRERIIGAHIIIAKHRHGPTGEVDAVWVPEMASFREATEPTGRGV